MYQLNKVFVNFGDYIFAHLGVDKQVIPLIENVSHLFTDLSNESLIVSDYAKNLIYSYISPRYWYRTIYAYNETIEDGITTANEVDKLTEWEGRFYSWLLASQDRFKILLDAYETKKTTLLESIKRNQVTKTNETPQNGGAFEDDSHENLYVKNEVQDESGTPAQRLKDIEDNISDLYQDWSDEFEKFTMYIEEM